MSEKQKIFFRRPCIRCGSMFRPNSKFTNFCIDCYKKRIAIRKKRIAIRKSVLKRMASIKLIFFIVMVLLFNQNISGQEDAGATLGQSVYVSVIRGNGSTYADENSNEDNSSNLSKFVSFVSQAFSYVSSSSQESKKDAPLTTEEIESNFQEEQNSSVQEQTQEGNTLKEGIKWGWEVFWFLLGGFIGFGICVLIYRIVYGVEG